MGDRLHAVAHPGPRASRARNPLRHPAPGDVVVFLLAHPDDESFFTGGTIARLARAGATTVVVTATLGELGRPSDPRMRAELRGDAAVAAIRGRELRDACEVLGVAHQVLLGGAGRWKDSGHPARAGRRDRLAANVEAATVDLLEVLLAVRPGVLVSFDAGGCTGHPDHVACHRMALVAATLLTRFARDLRGLALIVDGRDEAPRALADAHGMVALDVTRFRRRKVRAVACHRSQVGGAADDPSALGSLDPASAVTRYLPWVAGTGGGRHVERYRWLPAAELVASPGESRSLIGSEAEVSHPRRR